ncbi:MAG: 4Fe-4S binding protein [Planctomycetota bacterium]
MIIQKYRTLVQTLALLALHSSWGPQLKWLCNPVLSCHSCVLAWFACPIGVFVHYSGYHLFPVLALGTVLLLGIALGRLLCGWICPIGFLQDLLYKVPSRKFALPSWTSYVKYLVLVLMVGLFPFFWGEETLLSFCRYCPASAAQVTIPNLIGGSELTAGTLIKLGILAGVIGLAVFSTRSFCKVFCPIGALLAPLNFVSLWVVKPARAECAGCEKCGAACPSGGDPQSRIEQGIPPSLALDCVLCHQCQVACPQWRKEKRQERGLTAGLAGRRKGAAEPGGSPEGAMSAATSGASAEATEDAGEEMCGRSVR